MKPIIHATLTSLIFALMLTPAVAKDFKAGALVVGDPWTRATPQGAPAAGGFFSIVNTGATPDRLVGGSSPAAAEVQVHEMTMDSGVMRMRQLAPGLPVASGATTELRPGGLHVMLVGLKAPLKEGASIPVVLRFERAGEVRIDMEVRPIGWRPAP